METKHGVSLAPGAGGVHGLRLNGDTEGRKPRRASSPLFGVRFFWREAKSLPPKSHYKRQKRPKNYAFPGLLSFLCCDFAAFNVGCRHKSETMDPPGAFKFSKHPAEVPRHAWVCARLLVRPPQVCGGLKPANHDKVAGRLAGKKLDWV